MLDAPYPQARRHFPELHTKFVVALHLAYLLRKNVRQTSVCRALDKTLLPGAYDKLKFVGHRPAALIISSARRKQHEGLLGKSLGTRRFQRASLRSLFE